VFVGDGDGVGTPVHCTSTSVTPAQDGFGVFVGDGVNVGVAVGVGVSDVTGVGVFDGVGVGVLDGVGEGVLDGVGDGVFVAVGGLVVPPPPVLSRMIIHMVPKQPPMALPTPIDL
jgi:hypothetical protein